MISQRISEFDTGPEVMSRAEIHERFRIFYTVTTAASDQRKQEVSGEQAWTDLLWHLNTLLVTVFFVDSWFLSPSPDACHKRCLACSVR